MIYVALRRLSENLLAQVPLFSLKKNHSLKRRKVKKKADVIKRRLAFDHVGILANGPPGTAGLPFI
jgi:hypothetical protein